MKRACQIFTPENSTRAFTCEGTVFVGCLSKSIDVYTGSTLVKFKRFTTESHPNCFCQLGPNHILVGMFGGRLACIDSKTMRITDLGLVGEGITKIEHITKVHAKKIAIATSHGVLMAKFEVSPHTGIVDLEVCKTNGRFLGDLHVLFVDEFERGKLFCVIQDSGTALIVDRLTKDPSKVEERI